MKLPIKKKAIKRILIVGDAGRGKTTFAKHISKAFDIPVHSLDDILWKKKYSEIEDRPTAINKIKEIVEKDFWIVEGTTRYLAEHAFDAADMIFHFRHRTWLGQVWHLLKRFVRERDGSFSEFLQLVLHSVYKRHSVGYCRGMKKWHELIQPFEKKIIVVDSRKKMRKLCDTIDTEV